jgi:hypothetical protein
MIYNFPFQQVACAIYGEYKNCDPFATKTRCLEYKHNNHVIIDQNSVMAMFQEPRRKTVYYNMNYDPEKKKITLRGKPYQVGEFPFLKLTPMNVCTKKGEKEQIVKSIQYFTFYTFTVTQIDDQRTLVDQSLMVDVGGTGFPLGLSAKRAQGLQGNFLKILENMEKKTIKEHKYEFNELWEGIPVNPFGKLLYDLDIDSIDSLYEEKMKKRKEVFNISNYCVHFQALQKKDIAQKYHHFLIQENISDSWDFIIDIQKLTKYWEKKNFDKTSEKLKEILKFYIYEDSPKKIEMSKESRNELIQNIEKSKKEFASFKYFDEIYQRIKLEHQCDHFQQFVKSSIAKELLSKFQHDLTVMSPISDLLSVYRDEDFQKKNIDSVDFEFVSTMLSHSSTWDTLSTTNDFQVSVSHVNWYPNVSFIDSKTVSYLYEYQFNFPLERVANAFFSFKKRNKIDPNISKSKLIEYIQQKDHEFDMNVTENEMIWVWGKLLLKRNISCIVKQKKSIYYVSKPLLNDFMEKESQNYFHFEIICLSEDNGKTKFSQIISVHSRDSLDWDTPAMERAKTFYLSLLDSIDKASLKIENMAENYSEMESNGIPKDPLGKMLLKSTTIDAEYIIESNFSDNDITETFIIETDLNLSAVDLFEDE